jgi:hypothetical protein
VGKLASRLLDLKASNNGKPTIADKEVIEREKIEAILNGIDEQKITHSESSSNHKEVIQRYEGMMNAHKIMLTDLNNSINAVNEILNDLTKTVSAIKLDVDLSGIEKSIKNIKPANIESLTKTVDDLFLMVNKIENKAVKEPKKVDLSQIITAIEKPRQVEFEVITNTYGLPVKVIATENGT